MNKKTWLAIITITFIAFILRIYQLDFVSLRGDEAFTVVFVQRTWDGLWKGIRTIEPNPPLMYLALRVWVAIAGASEFVTRYFSLFFGVLCVPLLYRLAKEMFGASVIAGSREATTKQSPPLELFRNDQAIALIAAALITINPYQIWHSQDVRNYTMWPALSLLALVFFWRWWTLETPALACGASVRDWRLEVRSWNLSVTWNLVFYILATLASLYTHYYDVFILAALNIFVFAITLIERRWKTLARWIGAQVVLVLCYAPWVLFGTDRITSYGEASAEKITSLLDVFSRTLSTFVTGDTVPENLKTLVWLPLALGVIAALLYLARRDRSRAAFLFLCIGVPTIALYIISIGRPLFLERYLNGIAPEYYLIFAIGIAALASLAKPVRKLAFAGALGFFIIVSGFALNNYFFDPAYVKAPDWRALMRFISERRQDGDFVIQNFTEMSAIYYRPADLPVMTLPKDYLPKPTDEKTLEQLNADYRRIWFIPAAPDFWDPEHFVENYLSRTDERILEQQISTFRLQLYLTPREFSSKFISLNAHIGNATLTGYRVEGTRLLHVVLYWHADKKIDQDYSVFVHLMNGNQVVAQQDRAPAFGTRSTSTWLPGESIIDVYDLPVNAPAGTYSLSVGMYDPTTLVRVPALDANGAPLTDNRVTLTTITIPQ